MFHVVSPKIAKITAYSAVWRLSENISSLAVTYRESGEITKCIVFAVPKKQFNCYL
jgi:hypothetical protein